MGDKIRIIRSGEVGHIEGWEYQVDLHVNDHLPETKFRTRAKYLSDHFLVSRSGGLTMTPSGIYDNTPEGIARADEFMLRDARRTAQGIAEVGRIETIDEDFPQDINLDN